MQDKDGKKVNKWCLNKEMTTVDNWSSVPLGALGMVYNMLETGPTRGVRDLGFDLPSFCLSMLSFPGRHLHLSLPLCKLSGPHWLQ